MYFIPASPVCVMSMSEFSLKYSWKSLRISFSCMSSKFGSFFLRVITCYSFHSLLEPNEDSNSGNLAENTATDIPSLPSDPANLRRPLQTG